MLQRNAGNTVTAITEISPASLPSASGIATRSLAVVCDSYVATTILEPGTVTIGRHPELTVVVSSPRVSRKHAILRVSEVVVLEDAGSANGVYVGSKRLEVGRPHVWNPGESVRIGDVRLYLLNDSLAGAVRGELAKAPVRNLSPVMQVDRRRVLVDPTMVLLDARARAFAASEIGVLLLGETGTGKEVFAEAIHRGSARAAKPFVTLNCASLTETLLESELFGHERGAFTGAVNAKPGLLETANGGTVFLDEVGEMPLALQAKLLRVLEQRTVLRVGALVAKPIDVRFVSATNRDIEAEVERGTFRRDLYYRLSGTTLMIPPLRERPSEIAPLARLFAERIAKALGRSRPPEISAEALGALRRHSWPGNIRELRNSIEQAVILCADGPLLPEHLPADRASSRSRVAIRLPETEKPPPGALPEELRSLERERILDAITKASGNQTEAAKLLGMSRAVLLRRLDAYGLPRPRKRAEPDGRSHE